MRRVDLHTHSTASDGTDAPAALARLAKDAGLEAFALTDHDTLAGIPDARAAADALGIELVPGVELGARIPEGELHILGYFLEPGNATFDAFLEELRKGRRDRAARTVTRLNDLGVAIDLADVEAEVSGDRSESLGRPHIASALVKGGHVASIKEAFDRYLKDGGPANVPRPMPSPVDAVRAIVKAGGVAVVAHPWTVPRDVFQDLLVRLRRVGLAGVEVVHSDQDADVREHVARLAADMGLVQSGGSDYHGTRKPAIRLGTGRNGNVSVPYEVLEELRGLRKVPV